MLLFSKAQWLVKYYIHQYCDNDFFPAGSNPPSIIEDYQNIAVGGGGGSKNIRDIQRDRRIGPLHLFSFAASSCLLIHISSFFHGSGGSGGTSAIAHIGADGDNNDLFYRNKEASLDKEDEVINICKELAPDVEIVGSELSSKLKKTWKQ